MKLWEAEIFPITISSSFSPKEIIFAPPLIAIRLTFLFKNDAILHLSIVILFLDLSYSFDYYIIIIFLESVSLDYYVLALLYP